MTTENTAGTVLRDGLEQKWLELVSLQVDAIPKSKAGLKVLTQVWETVKSQEKCASTRTQTAVTGSSTFKCETVGISLYIFLVVPLTANFAIVARIEQF